MDKPLHISFSEFIKQNKLFTKDDKLLLAFSGGIDSVVLAHLLISQKYKVELAHCNFQLRGVESEQDELFVTDFAKQNNLFTHIKRFDTKKYAADNKLTIQQAARNLRYNFFIEIAEKENFPYILTAHHLDDSIETFFINLLRGTGLKGLCGIPMTNSKFVRPLLFATKNDIYKYATIHNINWREDSSNQGDKYLRNKIRHQIIPILNSLQPNFYNIFRENFRRLNDSKNLIETLVQETINTMKIQNNDYTIISIPRIIQKQNGISLLFHYLQNFQFNEHQVKQILEKKHQTGKKFVNQQYTAIYNRDTLIITKNKKSNTNTYWIDNSLKKIKLPPFEFQLSFQENSEMYTISKDPNKACFDAEKVQFPLQLRKWQKGDYFYPFGMEHAKKISDFLIDKKMSLIEKENTWVLLSGNSIIWVVGQRIDNRFRITKLTKKILEILVIQKF